MKLYIPVPLEGHYLYHVGDIHVCYVINVLNQYPSALSLILPGKNSHTFTSSGPQKPKCVPLQVVRAGDYLRLICFNEALNNLY